MSVRIQNDIEIGPILQQQAAVGNTGLEEREDKPDNRAWTLLRISYKISRFF